MSTIIEKQSNIRRLFSKLISNQTMQHAYVFEGFAGTGKKEMALWVAQALFCQNPGENQAPCGNCHQCQRIQTHQHPDVIEIEPDGLSIKVAQVRELKEEFSKSGVESKRKLFIIEDIEKMTQNAANSLLKFLEEPDGETTALLLTTAKQRLLPTILSRCQIVHFPVRPLNERISELEERGLTTSQSALTARITHDAERAVALAGDEAFQQLVVATWNWFKFLSKKDDQSFVYVQTDLMSTVKDREDNQLVVDLLIIIYRDLLNLTYSESVLVAFVNHEPQLKQLADQYASRQITEILTQLLEAKKKLNSNVAAQGVFEDIALQMIRT
ncbi:DNA polymerase III subunit delta' [Marinilactibacillus kalidii]|uniref:DNA polymerase III subunit delta' n=1 Tax=Marinilactibacillus kalidii TaxID=2820274 RepID=UPI001ABE313E|nr:DNA polymerase III subunit delta' [Marinilactibacillus kalidii]